MAIFRQIWSHCSRCVFRKTFLIQFHGLPFHCEELDVGKGGGHLVGICGVLLHQWLVTVIFLANLGLVNQDTCIVLSLYDQ